MNHRASLSVAIPSFSSETPLDCGRRRISDVRGLARTAGLTRAGSWGHGPTGPRHASRQDLNDDTATRDLKILHQSVISIVLQHVWHVGKKTYLKKIRSVCVRRCRTLLSRCMQMVWYDGIGILYIHAYIHTGWAKSVSFLSSNFSKMVKDTKVKLLYLKENRLTSCMIPNLRQVSIELRLPSSYKKWVMCDSFICACARSRHHHVQGTSE